MIDIVKFVKSTVANIRKYTTRADIAERYLKGVGIEIGALQDPLRVSDDTHVKYLDLMSTEALYRQYPEKRGRKLVHVDIIDDGEKLETVLPNSQDFIIANHVLEHCENPIGTLEVFLNKVKTGGCLFIAVPDKQLTFDKNRPVTPVAHIVRDYKEGPSWSRLQHYREVVEEFSADKDPESVQKEIDRLIAINYRIHFHVWRQNEVLEMLMVMQSDLGFRFDIELVMRNQHEIIFVIRKISDTVRVC